MNDTDKVRRAERAKAILDDPLWAEMWEMYRTRLLDIIEAAKSTDSELIMDAKRLLVAGKTARLHLTGILQDGAVSAAQIELDKKYRKSTGERG